MARVRMVTRTINVTECECIFMNLTTLQPVIKTVELTGDTYDTVTAEKVLQKTSTTITEDNEVLKFVAIKSITVREDIYGMLETDFIQYAKKLDNDRKVIED